MSPNPLISLLNAIPRDIILPPASLFIAIGIGLFMRRRWPAAGTAVAGAALAALLVLSTSAGANLFVAPLERLTAPLRAIDRIKADAIVVLAAGRLRAAPEYGDRDIPDYYALARLRYAARLQRHSGLPVLVSGGNGANAGLDHEAGGAAGASDYSKADAMAMALREDFGIPVKWVEGKSRDTAENAAFSAAILRPQGMRRIVLVTDAMHMPRAKSAFEQAGFDVLAAPTTFFSGQPRGIASLLPSAEGMRRSWYAIYELLAIGWYRLRFSPQDAAAP
jgi:uncharacterized SAM-binding protein YcdF (DUF218 family)